MINKGIVFLKKKVVSVFTNSTLMKRLIITYILIIGVPIIIFSFYTFTSLSKNAKQDTINRANYDLNNEYDSVEKNVYIMRNIVNSMEVNSEVLEYLQSDNMQNVRNLIDFKDRTYRQVISLQNSNPTIKQINIFTDNSKTSELWPTFYRVDRISHNDWYRKTLEKNGTEYWNINHYDNDIKINSAYNDESKDLVVSLNKDVEYQHNKYLGISRVTMRSKDFFPKMFQENIMKSGQIFFINKDNMDIKTDDNSLLLKNTSFDMKKFKEAIKDKLVYEKGQITYSQGKEDYIVLYKESPIPDNYLLSVISTNNILQGVKDSRLVLIWGSSFLLIILSVVIHYSTKKILKRLYKIINAVKQVRSGDLMPSIEVYGTDEVGVLAHNFRQMMKTIDLLIKESINKEVMTKEAELKALKTQIDSHFLYNTLENIRMMALVEENYIVSDCLASLGDMMRYNMKWNNEFVPLSEEIKHIKNYIALMTLRYDFEIILDVDIGDEFLNKEILKLTIQPLVENAVKHGLAEKLRDENGIISISVHTDENYLYLSVMDEGKGMDTKQVQALQSHINGEVDKKFGVGLKNVNDRIKLFYGSQYGIVVEAQKYNYTRMILKLPN
jgi:two-component system sensor histidine kinase YesM